MLTLLAIDSRDGWVFVEDNIKILLLRPPYKQSEARIVSSETVRRAVDLDGFRAESRSFEGWAALIAFVRAEVLRQSQLDGRALGHAQVGEDVLKYASPTLVSRLLDRVATDLLAEGLYVKAEEMVDAILHHARCIREDDQLWDRTKALHAEVKRRQREWQEDREKLVRREDAFPRLRARGRLEASWQQADRVKRRGSLFAT